MRRKIFYGKLTVVVAVFPVETDWKVVVLNLVIFSIGIFRRKTTKSVAHKVRVKCQDLTLTDKARV